jgi:hypothetical protein
MTMAILYFLITSYIFLRRLRRDKIWKSCLYYFY